MDGQANPERLRTWLLGEGLALLLITALAALLRFWALGQLPPGLYHDEAFNGLDALGVLRGHTPLYFAANNGREPLFIYLAAASVRLWGRSPGALRWVSACVGTLTIPALYLLGRALFSRRIALLAALLASTTVWTLNLSRVAFRAVLLPPLAALALWALWSGLQERGRGRAALGRMALAGVLYGALFYTYLAARFTPIALFLYLLYSLARERRAFWWRGWALWALVAGLTILPLAITLALDPAGVMARTGQVAIWNPAISGGDPWGTLLRHLVATARLFIDRGDFIPRHNVPWRPVFNPLVALAFWVGLGLAGWRARREPAYLLCLLWLGAMLLPTVMAEDAPHMLRAVGALPVLFFFPAIALERLLVGHPRGVPLRWRIWLRARRRGALDWRRGAVLVVAVVWLSASTADLSAYWRHLHSPAAYYNFESGATQMAVEINAFLGRGWQGSGLRVDSTPSAPFSQVWIAPRLWQNWPSLRYLCAEQTALRVLPADEGAWPAVSPDERLLLVLWPFDDLGPPLAHMPTGRLIQVREGAQECGDLEADSRLLYVTVTCESPADVPHNVATDWQGGIRLLGYRLAQAEGLTTVTLYWQSAGPLPRDETVFCHLLAGDRLVGQHDSPAALGYYGTERWRAGDIVADVHPVALIEGMPSPTHLAVGLYYWENMEHRPVLGADGRPTGQTELLIALN